MKIWTKTAEFSEGKFLVIRRDGTIPKWPHFVLGARDPCSPSALRGYAGAASRAKLDPAYIESLYDLADDFTEYRRKHGAGDPDAPPHRKDDPRVLAMMRGHLTFSDVLEEAFAAGVQHGKSLR